MIFQLNVTDVLRTEGVFLQGTYESVSLSS
jgi:hypothetical protein